MREPIRTPHGRVRKEHAFTAWLTEIDGFGAGTIRRLIQLCGSAEAVYRMPARQAQIWLKPKLYAGFLAAREKRSPEESGWRLQELGIRLITEKDTEFPEKFRQMPNAPYCIYAKGQLPDPRTGTAAVIGARICSEYGRYMAREYGMQLALAGVQVVSGMAAGIDGIGQKAALQAGGYSCAVLGSGVDVCYPPENRELYEQLLQEGGIISEFPPGTPPRAQNFPLRNRLISALSDLVLVVEAKRKSGTLITVDMALEQGREVYAVPGRVTDRLSDGCNDLLRQGAGVALSPQELTAEFYKIISFQTAPPPSVASAHRNSTKYRSPQHVRKGTERGSDEGQAIRQTVMACGESAPSETPMKSAMLYTSMEQTVQSVLDINPLSISAIHERLSAKGDSVAVPELMRTLVQLTLKGDAVQDGDQFRRRMR